MAFRSNMSTQELVQWLKGCGVHPYDCKKLEDEKFTGGSFLVLDKEDFKELNCSFSGRKLLGKLLEQVKCEPESDTPSIQVDPPQSLPLCGTMVLSSGGNRPQGGSNTQPDGAAGGWAEPKKIWESGTILKVYFLNPSMLESWICGRMAMNTANVLSWAKVWKRPFRNKVPEFDETDNKDDADIRVEFIESGICWSMVGRDAQNIMDKFKPTMCLNLKGHSQKQQKSLVIHEFGHVLGLEHEHQRSDFWKIIEKHLNIDAIPKEEKQGKGAVYGTDWCKKGEGGKLSEYDPKSIMHYTFMIDWLNNKEYQTIGGIDRDSKLKEKEKVVLKGIFERSKSFAEEPSETDFNFLEEVYGGRPVGKTLPDGPEASNHRQPARIRTSQPKKVVEGINRHSQKVIGNKRSIRTIEYEPAVDDSKKGFCTALA